MNEAKEATPEEAKRVAIRCLDEAMVELVKKDPDLAHVYYDVECALIWLRAKRPFEEAHPDTQIGRRG